jgi:N-acetyl-anhydromuramyl-L-alanine amidase AmpD
VLKRVSESLVEYVQRRRAYNFLIDRFGRVYRIVRETDAANHAGHSIWADDSWIYLNLNDSFLGVSFEAETSKAEKVNPAQVRAGAMLTEMLRSRYRINAANCVTHAQVSVNPSNFQIGYHTDWASSFPFERLGLADNYALPLPALALFGFGYDAAFVQRVGPRLAEAARESVVSDPRGSRRRYSKLAKALRHVPEPAVE